MTSGSASTTRCTAVWATGSAAALGLGVWLVSVLAATRETLADPLASFDGLLAMACAAVALPTVAWLWLLTTVVVVEALRGVARPVPGMPGVLRRAVLAACGVAALSGLAVPAHAAPGEVHQDRRPQTAADVIAGLPLPDRAVAQVEPGPGTVVVRPGDTLWEIARRDLGSEADDAAITARWHEIYALNRSVIGADPDLIQPAQRLRLPAG